MNKGLGDRVVIEVHKINQKQIITKIMIKKIWKDKDKDKELVNNLKMMGKEMHQILSKKKIKITLMKI
jgi:hypothetical protein